MQKEEKLRELIEKLKKRNNDAYKFFEQLLAELKNVQLSEVAREKLVSCMAITQYASFNYEEEQLLGEIIEANLNS